MLRTRRDRGSLVQNKILKVDNLVNIGYSSGMTERLDRVLAKQHPEHSRGFWQKQIAAGRVSVDGSIIIEPDFPLAEDSELTLSDIPAEAAAETATVKPAPALDVLHEDEAIIVLNKAAGVVVHPAHAHTNGGTLVDALLKRWPAMSQAVFDPTNAISLLRPGIVHRLDQDTSGVIVVAKTTASLRFLAKELEAHRFFKQYIALVHGRVDEATTINKPLGRHAKNRKLMAVTAAGKPAVTRIQPCALLEFGGQTLSAVIAEPVTGRTHQLRVHLKSISRPVLGDRTYTTAGCRELSSQLGLTRQALHAASLRLRHPQSREYMVFQAPLPIDFRSALQKTTILESCKSDDDVCRSMILPLFKG